MLKGRIIYKICFFTAMIAFHLFYLNSPVLAEDCADKEDVTQTPTAPGNAEYPPGWHCTCDPYIPLEFDPNNPEEINPGESIEIAVLDGCLPFICEVSGSGYSLEETEDERTYTLSSTGGT